MGEVGDNRKIALVAILGVSPAVLTEAVWALANQDAPVVPDEILVLTTGMGLKNLDEQIQIDKKKGVWASLKHDLEADGVSVEGKLNVRVELFLGEDNKPTEDLPTEATNLRAADKMMKELRDYTDDEGWIVYGLLAGGRKTMSALFFSCMCLLGRRDDRIYHVLVSDGYENRLDPPFCYPQKGVAHRGKIHNPKMGRKNSPALIDVKLKSEDCKINLFSVPFVCMGEWCQAKCKGKRLSYGNLIEAVGKSLDAAMLPDVEADLALGDIKLNGRACGLADSEFALFVYLAQKLDSKQALGRLDDLQQYLEDAGSPFLVRCGKWLVDFSDKDSKMFYKPQYRGVEREIKIRADLTKVKNRMKEKLPSIFFDHLFGARLDSRSVRWNIPSDMPREVLKRLFPSGIPKPSRS